MEQKSKTLEFKKEEIVNLNEQDLLQVQGGATSTWGCIGSIAATITVTFEVWDHFGPKPEPPTSENIMHTNEGPACLLPETVIYGLPRKKGATGGNNFVKTKPIGPRVA